jgi:16S rRNA (guanine966-N2)-methyltransferase
MDMGGVRVLDLFAGSGALGIESLSRGAAFCTFVEDSASARKAITANIAALSLNEVTRTLRRDATRLGAPDVPASIGLVFADPPYGKGLGERAVSSLVENDWLAAQALLVLEERKESLPENLIGFQRIDVRTYGGSAIGLFQFAG